MVIDKTSVKVKFSIYDHEFDPELVTQRLGIIPTECWFKGDKIEGRKILKRKETGWVLSTEYEESSDVNDQLIKVIGVLEDKVNLLKEISEKYNAKLKIDIIIRVRNGKTPVIILSQRIISFVHGTNARIDIDVLI
jgi:hypothetical protein